MKVLRSEGTRAGEPFVKHLDGEIRELRPLRNRILFAAWHQETLVLLHCFVKKSQKTPKRGSKKAQYLRR
ncbi:MAG: type II toxin-antitoxin system RelE/ParE family toxin [Bacillota bacterium]|nr:type II toxin-antitoxin system RelE/ParE family toxin [Bacillota bacterium]